jgi:hypothetical protein
MPGSWVPRISSACLPEHAATFARLKDQLGDTMGEPLACTQRDAAGGDVVQPTTKGFAYMHRGSGAPSFTTGHEFWALMPAGIEHWTGSLHGGMDPPSMVPGRAAPLESLNAPAAESYATVFSVVLMQAPDPADGALVIEHDGTFYRAVPEPGEPGLGLTVGQTLFIRATGAFDAADAEVIAVGSGGGYRRITSLRQL